MFRGFMHQDAHEFLNFTLNTVADNLVAEIKRGKDAGATSAKPKSFVHDIFEGVLTNETKCLECESVTIRVRSVLLKVALTHNAHCAASCCAVSCCAGGGVPRS
jgi:ubiquitin C-terminal hydrolase